MEINEFQEKARGTAVYNDNLQTLDHRMRLLRLIRWRFWERIEWWVSDLHNLAQDQLRAAAVMAFYIYPEVEEGDNDGKPSLSRGRLGPQG